MKSRLCLFLIALCGLSGCFPEERVWWSPQGDRAVISIADELHFVTADGVLGPALGVSLEKALIKTVSWLPDGSGFVCHRERAIATWEEVCQMIPHGESAAVEKLMPAVMPLLEAAVTLAAGADSLGSVASAMPMVEKSRFAIAVKLSFQRDAVAVERLLRALPKGAQIVESMQKAGTAFQVSELCVVKLTDKAHVTALTQTCSLLTPPLMPKVSPKHDVVAYLTLDEKEESAALMVLPLNGSSVLTVARGVSGTFDWMPDGQSLVFMAAIGGEGEKLQSIHRISVVQENGALMKPRDEALGKALDRMTEPVTLATAITLNRPHLQVLADGRVLFASQPAVLPAVGTGPELEPRLYIISADGKEVRPIATAPGDLPTNLGYFVASPDGRLVAVVESETDAVAVVELSSGKTQIISPPHPHWQCETIPAWKSATELSFAALHGTAQEPHCMIWSESAGLRCISEKWPVNATAKWLEQKKPSATR
ncbi:MAG: hypothetical protein NTV80_13390 [Verrucomicrobia bacterium]|nr:hypothetical protein [Verrucomicrobiota bacterium]